MSHTPVRTTIRCRQEVDITGSLEEFTTDLNDVTNNDISHLADYGLPKTGTRVRPGMLLIGKIGQKKSAPPRSEHEYMTHFATVQELEVYYEQWLYDGSVYVPKGCFGTVGAAYFESTGDRQEAVVEIEFDTPPESGETNSSD